MKMPGNKNPKKGSGPFIIEYLPKVVSKDIPSLPKTVRNQIKKVIETRLTVDPIGFGKPLRYSLKGARRLRVGDYRIVYQVKNNKVIISAIKHRKEVYENA
jgi:mRNA interferase RelE/StbE